MNNILVYTLKGGAAKSTNSSIIASNLSNCTLVEIDKINQSQNESKDANYTVKQIDFLHENQEGFIEFENILLDKNNVVIDVGASRIDNFHSSMLKSNLYDTIDLLVISSMDGFSDFSVCLDLLTTIQEIIPSSKIILSFNRFNEHEYSTVEEQFDNFFTNKELLFKSFSIDLNNENSFYILKDSRAVKYSHNIGLSLKSLSDMDLEDIIKKQRSEKNKETRLELTKQKSLITQAQSFHNIYVVPMMEKINRKLNIKEK